MRIIIPLLLFCFICTVRAEDRVCELGIVDYLSKYDYPDEARNRRSIKVINKFIENIEKVSGTVTEKVDVDFFLEANREKLSRFKRIIIPPAASWFTAEMYQGMAAYVNGGGLLISFEALILLDKDSSYEAVGGDITKFPRDTFLGLRVADGGVLSKYKSAEENPLSAGISSVEWTAFEGVVYGRSTRKKSANVAISAEFASKKKKYVCPMVTYKTSGKGSCVYLGFNFNPEVKVLSDILKNTLSEKTFNWLCRKD
ncbi:MAG: hypothetical protein ACYTFY_07925 [Planctomycetota bacterium]|jgi:hypothetical protein